jgi:hypothetical protein
MTERSEFNDENFRQEAEQQDVQGGSILTPLVASEYGSWEWAVWMENYGGFHEKHSAEWWYNQGGPKAERERRGV